METVLATLAIAAFVGAYLLWGRAKGAGPVTTRNRTPEPSAAGRRIEFAVGSTPVAALQAIRQRVGAPDEPPPLVGALYLAEATDCFLRYVIGTRTTTTATAVVVVTAEPGARCRGEYRVLSWTEVDEPPGRMSSLEGLACGVQEAVRALDAYAHIRVTATTP